MQDALKGYPDNLLAQEVAQPSGNIPSYLAISELTRRKEMRDRYAAQQAPQSSVAEDLVQGIMGVAQGGMPQQPMMGQPPQPQQPVMRMSNGGLTPGQYIEQSGTQGQRDYSLDNMLANEKAMREAYAWWEENVAPLMPTAENAQRKMEDFKNWYSSLDMGEAISSTGATLEAAVPDFLSDIYESDFVQNRLPTAENAKRKLGKVVDFFFEEDEESANAQTTQSAQGTGSAQVPTPSTTQSQEGLGGLAGMGGSFTQKLLERYAEGDDRTKDMALLSMGQKLLENKSPTFLGALGEAGGAGLSTLRKGIAGQDKMLGTLAGLEMKASQKKGTKETIDSINALAKAAEATMVPEEKAQIFATIKQLRAKLAQQLGVSSGGASGPSQDLRSVMQQRGIL